MIDDSGNKIGKCPKPGRVNKLGERKGFCMDCAKEHHVLRPGDHMEEPPGFAEFVDQMMIFGVKFDR
jgi:hypothetical protein